MITPTPPSERHGSCGERARSDPYQRDDRTDHESLPVESGVKYGVNYWIHMYPFRSMQNGNCDNQAYIQNWY